MVGLMKCGDEVLPQIGEEPVGQRPFGMQHGILGLVAQSFLVTMEKTSLMMTSANIAIKTRLLCNAAINAGANEALRKRRKDQRSCRSRLSRAYPSSPNTVFRDRFVSSRCDVEMLIQKKLIQTFEN